MIQYREALALILENRQSLESEYVDIAHALKRVLAEDLYAPFSLPSYNNSAMDGYALRAEETLGASLENPIWFEQIDCVGAGEYLQTVNHTPKTVIEIMTGAPVPEHCNAVIPVEKTVKNNFNKIGITQALKVGENIRYQGEDIQKNAFLLGKGETINAERIMTLAGLGFHKIPVFKKLKILVLATGKELVVNAPADERYQLHDCNSPFLQASLFNTFQCEVTTDHLFSDTDEEFSTFLAKQIAHKNCPNIIISTGAVSAGKYDFIPRSLKKLGATIIFHKVAIRPGKPILFAILQNGTLYFGLPGNPSAVAAGFRFFVYPLLRQFNAMPTEQPIYAKLEQTVTLHAPLCFFQKAKLYFDEKGCACVKILPGQASFMISPLLEANAWVMFEKGAPTIEKDTLVPVFQV